SLRPPKSWHFARRGIGQSIARLQLFANGVPQTEWDQVSDVLAHEVGEWHKTSRLPAAKAHTPMHSSTLLSAFLYALGFSERSSTIGLRWTSALWRNEEAQKQSTEQWRRTTACSRRDMDKVLFQKPGRRAADAERWIATTLEA